MTHSHTGHAGQHCDCAMCVHTRTMSTKAIERELSKTRDSDEFDALLAELGLRLEARSL